MYLKTVRSETSKSFAKVDAGVHVCSLSNSNILIALSSELAVFPISLEYTLPLTESVRGILNTHHEKGNVMKRIVFRTEGKYEDSCRLAVLVMKCAFREKGVKFRPMYISNEQIPDRMKQEFSALGGILEEARFSSFSHAQAAIEGNVEKGINALLISDSFMSWNCPGNVLNKPLENLECYLKRNEISVAIVQDYSEKVPRTRFPKVNGASVLKKYSLDARDSNNEMYCGEAFVLPYGVLPVFFIERKEDQNRLDIRYYASRDYHR